ncbi:DNA-directed DNA polymerase [Chytriomyces confervae]|uniref:DNA-directed DNA polymerase n=1 Tax=Chytriomyces confervae TaxID=246404 RepID=A0A507DAW5_9FUNG|nr:DNA-directed DNA polymerase [Chytriomyces confervae]
MQKHNTALDLHPISFPHRPQSCVGCTMCKTNKAPYNDASKRPDPLPGEHLEFEVFEIKPAHLGVYPYGLAARDKASKYVSTFLLEHKDEALVQAIRFHQKLKSCYQVTTKVFRCDPGELGTSIAFKKYCEANGFVLETGTPRQPQMDGGAERTIQTLKNMMHVFMFDCKAPLGYWGYAMTHAADIINVLPVLSANINSPEESISGIRPRVSHFQPFGSAVYYHLEKMDRTSPAAPRRNEAIYLGADSPSIVKLLDIQSGRVIRHRFKDCDFRHNLYPSWPSLPSPILNATGPIEPTRVPDLTASENIMVNTKVHNHLELMRMARDEPLSPETLHALRDKRKPPTLHKSILKSNTTHVQQHVNPNTSTSSRTNRPPRSTAPHRVTIPSNIAPAPQRPTRPFNRAFLASTSFTSTTDLDEWETQTFGEDWTSCALLDATHDKPASSTTAADLLSPSDRDPPNRNSAMKSAFKDNWIKAEQAELTALQESQTYSYAFAPDSANIIGSKWVYKIKLNADGSVKRFKARLVAQGYTQRFGFDYAETHSPVMRSATFRWLLALTALNRWSTRMLDISSAYLYGDLEDPVYMKQPPGHDDGSGRVYKLKKGLYGLKQAGRIWYIKLVTHLKSRGYVQSNADPCVFYKTLGTERVFLAIYVDDICFFGHQRMINAAFNDIKSAFKVRDLGPIKYTIGIQVEHMPSGIFIHQSKYIKEILARFSKYFTPYPISVPLPTSFKSAPSTETSALMPDPKLYLEAIGCLNYAAINTRPDLSTAVSYLSVFSSEPSTEHWDYLMRTYRYLNDTKDHGILYSNSGNSSPHGFADAAYNIHSGAKSQLGYLALLADGAISWKSTKTPIVPLSSTEAEYMSISELGREIQSFINLYTALDIPVTMPLTLFEDNMSTIHQCNNDVFSHRSKHINVRYHYIRELVNTKQVTITYIKTADQPADLLTKPLGRDAFSKHRSKFGMCSWTSVKILDNQ